MTKNNKNVLVFYAFGAFGLQAIFGFVTGFQSEFLNKMYASLDPSILSGAAVVLFISKLVSSFADPVIGVWIDRTGRNGVNLFQWVRRGIFPLAILSALLFVYIPFDRFGGKWAMYAYVTLVSVLWSVAMSLAEIPTQSMISYLSENDAGCKKLAAVTNIAKSAASGAVSVIVTALMLTVDMIRGAGNTKDSVYYLINALTITVFGALFMALLAHAKPEGVRQTKVDATQTTVTIAQMLRDLGGNRNVLIVFLINILGCARGMSSSILLQANGVLIGKVELFGRVFDTTTNAAWLPYVFGYLSSAAALFVVPAVNKRLREKKTYILFSVLDFIFSVGAYLFYVAQGPGSPLRYGNGAMYMIMTFSFIGSFLMGVNVFIPLAMTAEISRDESERKGQSYASAPYAVLTMSVKLGTALSILFGLLIVSAGGYNQIVYETGAITAKMQNTVMLPFMLIPGISTLVSAVPALFYKAPAGGTEAPAM
ncbi:MAG: MFS transporter [Clostridia bacterium]|nr:MFS transporter [Clostridia bacterium]